MNKLIRSLALLSIIPWSMANAQIARNEGFARTLAPEWMPQDQIGAGNRVSTLELVARVLAPQGPPIHGAGQDSSYDAILFFRKGESLSDWKGIVAIQDYIEPGNLSPEETLNKLKAKLEKKCPGTMQWTVIAKDDTSILYRWHSNNCGTVPEEDDIGRVIVGRYNWYVLDYSEQVHELSLEKRALWTKTFSDATFDSVTSSFNPAWISVDVDEVVPFSMDKVMTALTPAMVNQECKISAATAERIECKRTRVATTSRHEGSGGESVTAVLEAKGDQTQVWTQIGTHVGTQIGTHVRITTGKGFYGRLVKKNWSTPIFEGMMESLQKPQP